MSHPDTRSTRSYRGPWRQHDDALDDAYGDTFFMSQHDVARLAGRAAKVEHRVPGGRLPDDRWDGDVAEVHAFLASIGE